MRYIALVIVLLSFVFGLSAQVPVVPGQGKHMYKFIELEYVQDSIKVDATIFSVEIGNQMTRLVIGEYGIDTTFVYCFYEDLGGFGVMGDRDTTFHVPNLNNSSENFIFRTYLDTFFSHNPAVNRWFYTALDSVFMGSDENIYDPANILSTSKEDLDLSIYPNPTSGKLLIETKSENFKIELYNLSGRKVFSDSNSKEVNLSKFSSGMYVLKLTTDYTSIVRRVLLE